MRLGCFAQQLCFGDDQLHTLLRRLHLGIVQLLTSGIKFSLDRQEMRTAQLRRQIMLAGTNP